MSGIVENLTVNRLRNTHGDYRTLLPMYNGRMKTVMVNENDNMRYLAFPKITAQGIPTNCDNVIDQCISFNRPPSHNFTHSSCVYLPESVPDIYLPKLTVTRDSSDKLQVLNPSGMSYGLINDDALLVGPAQLIPRTSTLEFPVTDGGYVTKAAGVTGDLYYTGSGGGATSNPNNWRFLTDSILFSTNHTFALDSSHTYTPMISSYITTNYLYKVEFSESYIPFNRHTGVSNYSFGYIGSSGTNRPSFQTAIDSANADKNRASGTTYYDISTEDSLTKYLYQKHISYKYNTTNQSSSSYIWYNLPYSLFSFPNFHYDSAHPDRSVTFTLQYNVLTYGVANDPAGSNSLNVKCYGCIGDNDGFHRPASSTIRTTGSEYYQTVGIYGDFEIGLRESLNSVAFTVSSISGTKRIERLYSSSFVCTAATSSSSVIGTPVIEYNVDVTPTSRHALITYLQYDLINGYKVASDVEFWCDDRRYKIQVIKDPDSDWQSRKVFHYTMF